MPIISPAPIIDPFIADPSSALGFDHVFDTEHAISPEPARFEASPFPGVPGLESGEVSLIGVIAGQAAKQGPCRQDTDPERAGRSDHRTGE